MTLSVLSLFSLERATIRELYMHIADETIIKRFVNWPTMYNISVDLNNVLFSGFIHIAAGSGFLSFKLYR